MSPQALPDNLFDRPFAVKEKAAVCPGCGVFGGHRYLCPNTQHGQSAIGLDGIVHQPTTTSLGGNYTMTVRGTA
jgi:hypothetical protein